jgi:hypothetical protein
MLKFFKFYIDLRSAFRHGAADFHAHPNVYRNIKTLWPLPLRGYQHGPMAPRKMTNTRTDVASSSFYGLGKISKHPQIGR